MPRFEQYLNPDDYLDDPLSGVSERKPRQYRVKRERSQVVAQLSEEGDDTHKGFNPTFHGSKHERHWIATYLGPFYEDHVISDVLRQVKGGKEATVYCCQATQEVGVRWLAAKVYRPRMFRNLRNDAVYRKGREIIGEEGKEVRGRREHLAMAKKTDFGQILRHTTWLTNEVESLRQLHKAGADVPKPFASNDNAILMEYIGDENFGAPTLHQVRLEPQETRLIFDRLLHNVALFLQHDRIHADLSAFNVLYWEGDITIIDLPQAVNPYVNPQARVLLERDLERICQYFERYGIDADSHKLAHDLWERYIMHRDPELQRGLAR